MSRFELQPVDGGSRIHLPQGEILIGRGPFLGVSDKRVSRSHGLLENVEGQLRIKPTHSNPCFCQSSLNDPPEALEKDCWHPLQQGDLFSLLPGKYIYKVIAVGDDNTLRNSQPLEDEESAESSPETTDSHEQPAPLSHRREGSTPPSQGSTLAASVDQRVAEDQLVNPHNPNQSDAVTTNAENNHHEQTRERTKRVLPVWMMGYTMESKSPSTPKGGGVRSGARGKVASSERDSGASDVDQTPRKRVKRRKIDREDEARPEEILQDVSNQIVKPEQQLRPCGAESGETQEREVEMMEEEEVVRGRKTNRRIAPTTKGGGLGRQPQNNQRVGGAESQGSLAGPGPSSSRAEPRTPCPYGKDCYRKNPLHFQENSHPDDSDYEEAPGVEEEEAEDDDRPECPYGSDCYRKNPLHKKEYKHTKAPGKRTTADDSGDSFIDDDSEGGDEGSDYHPPGSDSEEEDFGRLQKEARVFLKRKR